MSIDWKNLAKPQSNGSDTKLFRQLLHSNSRISHYRPTQKGLLKRYFDRRVACVTPELNADFDDLISARRNHSNIAKAEKLLQRCWPEVHKQFGHIVRFLCPMQHREQRNLLHSCSGCFETDYGLVYVTVEHPFSLAEALVHEMAHHKLFAMGIGIESTQALILNKPDKLYNSPIILDRKRPMTAVFYAQYSFIHILQLDVLLYQHLSAKQDRSLVQNLIDYTLPKMKLGLKEIQENIKTDHAGQQFLTGFYQWTESTIDQAEQISLQAS